MFAALKIGLLGAFMLSAADPPDIAGQWSGEDWGTVVLNQTSPGEYSGSYTENAGTKPGRIQLKWSQIERRFNGTWREGEDRFGELSVRLVGDEIRGAHTTDPKSKINPARPQLADLTWTRGAAKPVPPREAAIAAPAQPLDLTGLYQTPASAVRQDHGVSLAGCAARVADFGQCAPGHRWHALSLGRRERQDRAGVS